jgi:hypothetical protein
LKISSRTRGETEVYQGSPCPNGHDGLRYKSTGQCVQCKRESGRKGLKARASLSDAVRRQARWIDSFEKNFKAVSKLGILRVLSSEYHKTRLQAWLYRMRNRWSEHPAERQKRLITLGEEGWWLHIDPPRHQIRLGFQVGTPEHKKHKKAVLQEWRQRNADKIRENFRTYYKTHPDQRKKAADARTKRFDENPGLAAYLTSLRRKREKAQRCKCCSNKEFREVYLNLASQGLETDHKMSLAIELN